MVKRPANDLDLYKQFVKTIFKMRYKGSMLGFLWVLMKPFFMFTILFIVFSATAGSASNLTSKEYAVYLLSGLIVFTFFSESIIWGMNSIMDRSGLIVKINFKREIAVTSSISMAVINLTINSGIILLLAVILGVNLSFMGLLYVLFIFLTMFIALYAFSLFSSLWLVHIRDLSHIMELVLQLLFYASAVFFPVSLIPERFRFIVHYNPIARFILAVREALISQKITDFNFILGSFAVAVIALIIGRIYFKRNILKIAEYF
ncbi:MAG: hypothetical protein Fur003_3680 [Candidatus Dojkabacteria bacterium]